MQNTNPPLIALKIMVSQQKKNRHRCSSIGAKDSRPDNAAAADCASARSGRGLPADDQNEWNAGKNDPIGDCPILLFKKKNLTPHRASLCGLPVGFSAPPGDWSPCITPPGSPCTIFSLCASSGRTPSSQPQGGFTGRELMLWIHRAIGGPAHVPSNQFWDGSKETNFGRDRRNGDGSKLHDLWLPHKNWTTNSRNSKPCQFIAKVLAKGGGSALSTLEVVKPESPHQNCHSYNYSELGCLYSHQTIVFYHQKWW